MMGKTSFEKLEIYQLASRMSDVVWEVVSGWAVFERDTVGKMLNELLPRLNAYLNAITRLANRQNSH